MSPQSQLKPLMEGYFLDYASYVIMDRAIPDLRDGCKPVQRRILHTLFETHDGKFHKVANIIGETMKLHPHGDASIGGRPRGPGEQGLLHREAGELRQHHHRPRAAAARVHRVPPHAPRRWRRSSIPPSPSTPPSYDGRRQEPKELPAKVPVLLMLGGEGHRGGHVHHDPAPQLRRAPGGRWSPSSKGRRSSCTPTSPRAGSSTSPSTRTASGRSGSGPRIEKVSGVQKLVIREIPFSTTTTSAHRLHRVRRPEGQGQRLEDQRLHHATGRDRARPVPRRGRRRRSSTSSTPTRTARSRSPPTWSSSGTTGPWRSRSPST